MKIIVFENFIDFKHMRVVYYPILPPSMVVLKFGYVPKLNNIGENSCRRENFDLDFVPKFLRNVQLVIGAKDAPVGRLTETLQSTPPPRTNVLLRF